MSDDQSFCGEGQASAAISEPKSIIDIEISELCAKLPPIDRTALIAWRKSQMHDEIVCTCKLIEVIPDETNRDESNVDNSNVPKMNADCNAIPEVPPFDGQSLHHPLHSDQASRHRVATAAAAAPATTHITDTATNNFKSKLTQSASEHEKSDLIKPPAKKPAVKSIFDLDFDVDDDDPITFKLNHNNNINLNTKENILSSSSRNNSNNDISDDKSCDELLFLNENKKNVDGQRRRGDDETGGLGPDGVASDGKAATGAASGDDDDEGDGGDGDKNVDGHVIAADSANPISINSLHDESKALDLNALALQSRFRIEEDPDCKAKQLYITSKQLITEFHIEKLHTAYIPNINGNWDETKCDEESTAPAIPATDDNVDGEHVASEASANQTTAADDDDDKVNATNDDLADDETVPDLENEPRVTEATLGLYERVVPLCNHLQMDPLPKNLSHINLDFGPSDEVEPDVFIASIRVKPEVSETTEQNQPSTNPCASSNEIGITTDNMIEQSDAIGVDSPDHADTNDDFPIYHRDNDIEYGR